MNEKIPFYELPLGYPVSPQPGITVLRDIPYVEDGESAALMDIYLPPGEAPPGGHKPVLFLHGAPLPEMDGRPWPKEWRVFQDYGNLTAANGLAAVMINHRYVGYEGLIQAIADALQAVQFLSERGAAFSVNAQRFGVWAFSGAGMLLSAFLKGDMAAFGCLVAFYPMLDLTHVQQAQDIYNEEQLIALSPLSLMETMPAGLPMFFARAGLDRPGLNRALDTFVKQALYHNLDLELRNLPQAGHGFDMLEQSAAGADTIQRAVDFLVTQLNSE